MSRRAPSRPLAEVALDLFEQFLIEVDQTLDKLGADLQVLLVGIRSGDTVERAGVVVGADGRNSFVAADYERIRNDETHPMYEVTHDFASLAPPTEEQQALFARLRDDPEQTNRFFGTVAGTVPIPEFFGAPVPA